ncbi:MAG: hypothetical protein EOR50_13305 [Mesorhizobium sp.]|nr:MAG: hypothetical protein EOR50_13305 [Mesorhizobium sp.]RWP80367.1 MAG: hypothetical protein EOR09_00975 [Mesorhizobium sp.]
MTGRESHERLSRRWNSVEFISARYERRSVLITAKLPFDEWNKSFPTYLLVLG